MVRLRPRWELVDQRPADFWARCHNGVWLRGSFPPGVLPSRPTGHPLRNIDVWVPADEFNAATAA